MAIVVLEAIYCQVLYVKHFHQLKVKCLITSMLIHCHEIKCGKLIALNLIYSSGYKTVNNYNLKLTYLSKVKICITLPVHICFKP